MKIQQVNICPLPVLSNSDIWLLLLTISQTITKLLKLLESMYSYLECKLLHSIIKIQRFIKVIGIINQDVWDFNSLAKMLKTYYRLTIPGQILSQRSKTLMKHMAEY
jgi:hypothetical protein